ncbi:MAG: type I-E CRISPR-associated protein Cas7/Cse4/CasC [Pyrinomonadaceae bacterium MAG19_C2-C3]|nr:type I-E CRISPR-associated protein Cas7/Cse4/CasC [Pyrinomonadaceae bacterium MAG19_C2-C3]
MKIELHLIQSFGPSCLNRDDTNSPKDCDFGGVRRARISSQCFKRALRGYFRANNLVPVGERTKRLRDELVPRLSDLQPSELVPYAVDAFVNTYYSKPDGKNPAHAAVLLFLSETEMETVAQIVREKWDSLQDIANKRAMKVAEITAKNAKKKSKPADEPTSGGEVDSDSGGGKYENLPKPEVDKEIVGRLKDAALSSDIALFGRMLAEHTEHKIEAACQVAHAISTHAVAPEFDFFTAVDDLKPDTEDAGAGMLGETGFNAAVFYRYALLDGKALARNLGDDNAAATETARAFLQAFIYALPTGKQNSMAAQNLPSLGFFVVRESGAPMNLANAFCTPARPIKEFDSTKGSIKEIGLLEGSVKMFADYWQRYTGVYGTDGIISTALFCLDGSEYVSALGEAASVQSAIEKTITAAERA